MEKVEKNNNCKINLTIKILLSFFIEQKKKK